MPCAAFRNFTRAALARFRLSEIVNSTNVLLPTKSLVSFVKLYRNTVYRRATLKSRIVHLRESLGVVASTGTVRLH